MLKSARDVLDFWFVAHGEDDWFGGKPQFDAALADGFTATHAAVARGEAAHWRVSPEGRLAEIIVLDQFSRQLYRDEARAFATDAMALDLARAVVALGADHLLEPRRRMFCLMPYMHSESLEVHDTEAIPLFTELGDENTLKFEIAHRDIIARFGRYPKRNKALGRESTAEERKYIEQEDGMF